MTAEEMPSQMMSLRLTTLAVLGVWRRFDKAGVRRL